MKAARNIVTVIHGSHLFGTNTPSSDTDYKGIHLPSGRGIILQRPENVIDKSVKAKEANGKNSQEAIDHQSYSLAKFARMLLDGDGVATEILFAPDSAIIEMDDDWPAIRDACKTLLTKEVKGFVGYCRQQAAKYGIKGSRMEAVEKLISVLEEGIAKHGPKARVEVIEPELEDLASRVDMISLPVIDTAHGKAMKHIECVDRKMSFRTQIFEAHKVYRKVWDNYGQRAQAAKSNEGVDWKAVSHAVRVARQAQELLRTGKITLPRPDAEELLAIKLGKFEYKHVGAMLEDLIDGLDTIESVLPESVPESRMDEIILPYYLSQIS